MLGSSRNRFQLHDSIEFCPKHLHPFKLPLTVGENSPYFISLIIPKLEFPNGLPIWWVWNHFSLFFICIFSTTQGAEPFKVLLWIAYFYLSVCCWPDWFSQWFFRRLYSLIVVFTCKYPANVFSVAFCHMLSSNWEQKDLPYGHAALSRPESLLVPQY